jgi:hypothetical protein
LIDRSIEDTIQTCRDGAAPATQEKKRTNFEIEADNRRREIKEEEKDRARPDHFYTPVGYR